MARLSRTVAQEIAALARRQHGVVARRQLLAVGVSCDAIRHRLRTGALIRVYPGVYRVGHAAPSMQATYIAAVLAAGAGSVLAGRAAAFLLGLIKGAQPPPEVIASTERKIPGVVVHRGRADPHARHSVCQSIPVTSVPRTLVDLAATLEVDDLAVACHEAGVKYRTAPRHIEAVLARRHNAPGACKLRAVIHGDAKVALSKLERRFLELLRSEGLPLPVTNRVAGSHRVDCRWPEHKLTVELDSYRFHQSRHAWERDRDREREAHARGDQIRRFTWGDVFEQPRPMLGELSVLIAVHR